MEETFQKEKASLDYTDPDNNQGGFHRRLRDRNLLQKRKTEAEEKATNQLESTRKRSKTEGKRSTVKRGRPRKTEALEKLPATEGEPIDIPESLPVESREASLTSGQVSHPAVDPSPLESDPGFFPDVPDNMPAYSSAPASVCPPVFASTAAFGPSKGSVLSSAQIPVPNTTPPQLPVSEPALVVSFTLASVLSSPQGSAHISSSASAPAPVLSSARIPIPISSPVPAPTHVLSSGPAPAPTPVLSSAPAPTPVLSSAPASNPASALTSQQETTYAGNIDNLGRVLIDDVGTDEKEDIYPSQDYRADQELAKQPSHEESEQNKDVSTFKSF